MNSHVRFAAVIVSFNPDIGRLEDTVRELQHQGFDAIVVDNSSANISLVRHAAREAKLVELPENRGIAAALNEGMRLARDCGAEWVLSLDQDSEIAHNMLQMYERFLYLPSAGALCPTIVKRGEDKVEDKVGQARVDYIEIDRCPTTGFLLSVKAWEVVGDYDEWMFIDYVDYDMCIRLRISGYKIYRIENTYIVQELGRVTTNRLLYTIGKVIRSKRLQGIAKTYNHSPLRNFYYVRNSLYYIQKYRDYIDINRERRKLIKWELKKLLLENGRLATLKSIINGIESLDR